MCPSPNCCSIFFNAVSYETCASSNFACVFVRMPDCSAWMPRRSRLINSHTPHLQRAFQNQFCTHTAPSAGTNSKRLHASVHCSGVYVPSVPHLTSRNRHRSLCRDQSPHHNRSILRGCLPAHSTNLPHPIFAKSAFEYVLSITKRFPLASRSPLRAIPSRG